MLYVFKHVRQNSLVPGVNILVFTLRQCIQQYSNAEKEQW